MLSICYVPGIDLDAGITTGNKIDIVLFSSGLPLGVGRRKGRGGGEKEEERQNISRYINNPEK